MSGSRDPQLPGVTKMELTVSEPDCSGVEGEKGSLEEAVQQKVFPREGRESEVALSSSVPSWRTLPGREAGSWPSSLSRQSGEVEEKGSWSSRKDTMERSGDTKSGEAMF